MKPSFEEVLQKIVQLYNLQRMIRNRFIDVNILAEELGSCYDDVLPSLLLMSKEQRIKFVDMNREVLMVVPQNFSA